MIKLLKKIPTQKPEIPERAKQLAHEDAELTKLLKNNVTLSKIKKKRDSLLAHQNLSLLFNVAENDQFRKDTNQSPEEIDALIDTLDGILIQMATRASFIPLTAPNTSQGREIKDIFEALATTLPAE